MTSGYSLLTLGPKDSFTDQATRYFSKIFGINENRIDYKSPNEEVVRVVLGNLDKYLGVVPFETTGGGLVSEVVRELIAGLERNPKIRAEYVMPIEQCLAHKGDLSKVKTIVTHQQSILQCQTYLQELKKVYHYLEVKPVESNSQAAILASQDETMAAICPALAAELYGLTHVVKGVQDSKNNETRFVMIGNEDYETPTGNDKTTLLYQVENRPRALVNALDVFAKKGLNLSGQHSIPTRIRLGDYRMLTEVEAHRLDDPMQRALGELEEWVISDTIYIFGSYPRHINSK